MSLRNFFATAQLFNSVYIFGRGKIKEAFLSSKRGVFFKVSVCSGEATLATSEIKFFCERQSPLDIELLKLSCRAQKLLYLG